MNCQRERQPGAVADRGSRLSNGADPSRGKHPAVCGRLNGKEQVSVFGLSQPHRAEGEEPWLSIATRVAFRHSPHFRFNRRAKNAHSGPAGRRICSERRIMSQSFVSAEGTGTVRNGLVLESIYSQYSPRNDNLFVRVRTFCDNLFHAPRGRSYL